MPNALGKTINGFQNNKWDEKKSNLKKHKQGVLASTRSKRGFMGLTKLIEACLDTGLKKSKLVSFSKADMRLDLDASNFFLGSF